MEIGTGMEREIDILFSLQNETEWQEYQRNCLEVVAKIAELLPAEAFSLLVRIQYKYFFYPISY